MLTANETFETAQWQKVREAISERWPEINRDELAECDDSLFDLERFVINRLDANADEVAAIVRQFAPSEGVQPMPCSQLGASARWGGSVK